MTLDEARLAKVKLQRDIQNLLYVPGSDHIVFTSVMEVDPDQHLIGNLDQKVYRVNDAKQYYEADDELCFSNAFVREAFGIRTKKSIFFVSRGDFQGAQAFYWESDGSVTRYIEGLPRSDSDNWSVSFTFEDYLERFTGKTVTRGNPRTRKKFFMKADKVSSR